MAMLIIYDQKVQQTVTMARKCMQQFRQLINIVDDIVRDGVP